VCAEEEVCLAGDRQRIARNREGTTVGAEDHLARGVSWKCRVGSPADPGP
jgi:hypothetical protein